MSLYTVLPNNEFLKNFRLNPIIATRLWKFGQTFCVTQYI
ncbi:unnamed protein product [Acanthoscelides obtectus]|uniref:Uncharacterized protein n=1 Tax=Acanthoscelides obtectus TaxID=200917 RepID=A0A9P0K6E7_ACAOB|nr:unnamed protein product [Acanthoscelides obtectus]CAK1622839.1 hypothetical protein AOBTE_LOCUS1691 [Acanthoscelides obtectus]